MIGLQKGTLHSNASSENKKVQKKENLSDGELELARERMPVCMEKNIQTEYRQRDK